MSAGRWVSRFCLFLWLRLPRLHNSLNWSFEYRLWLDIFFWLWVCGGDAGRNLGGRLWRRNWRLHHRLGDYLRCYCLWLQLGFFFFTP